MSPRVKRLMREVDLLVAEDTRHTRALLAVAGIRRAIASYHDHNEERRAPALVAELLKGRSVGLVCDAGTPLLDDPGYHLVRSAIAAGIPIESVPGPCAAVTALAGSGLPIPHWCYVGFLPRNERKRKRVLSELRHHPDTLVVLEAPHRLQRSLATMVEVLGDRPAVLAANLSKKGSRWYRASLCELYRMAERGEVARAELTLVIGGCDPARARRARERGARRLASILIEGGIPHRLVREALVRGYGLSSGHARRIIDEAETGGEE